METTYNTFSDADLAALREICGNDRVIPREKMGEDYSHDELSGIRKFPDVLVRAVSAEEVSQVLKYASSRDLPVTPRGAGTGLVGGAVALRGGIMLDLSRMNRFLELDEERLIPNPKPSQPYGEGLYEYRKQTAYCIATQAGIWNREFLLGLAKGKASIWEFERYGSFAVEQEHRPLLVTPTKEFPFVDAVHKGYWESFGIEVCKQNGVPIDFAARGRPPFSVRLREGLKDLIFAVFPWTLIVRIQNFFDVGMKEQKRTVGSNVVQ